MLGTKEEVKKRWEKIPSKILKAELSKRGLKYADLIKKLNQINVEITVNDLSGRIARGTFSAIFFLQCLRAIGVEEIRLEESYFCDFEG